MPSNTVRPGINLRFKASHSLAMDDKMSLVSASGNDLSSGDEGTTDGSHSQQKKKRSVPNPSCELCRIRKVKCDRAKPSCTWCVRHNRPCVYRERRRPTGDGTKNLELEMKLNHLGSLLHGLSQRVESHIVKQDGPPQASHSPVSFGTSSQHGLHQLNLASTSPETISSDLFWPGGHSPAVHSDHSSRWNSDIGPHEQIHPAMPTGQDMSLDSDPDLPPSDLLYVLVDLFFKHINTWCPLLDRKATFDTYFGSTLVTEGDRVVLHAIVATALRFSADPRLTPEVRARFHKTSTRKIELYGLKHTNLHALKALTLLSLDALGTSDEPKGDNLLTLITRNVSRLDLCVEKSAYLSQRPVPHVGSSQKVALPEPDSWVEDEGRRRLCWMVYVLDRYASVATSFEFMLEEGEMRRCLPCRYDLWSANQPVETRSLNWNTPGRTEYAMDTPENLGSFSYHCEVLTILSRIHTFVRKPIDICSEEQVHDWRGTFMALQTELSSWLHSLPGEYGKISLLCHSDPGARIVNWIILHAAFVVSTIRLNSVAAYPVVQSQTFTPSYRAMQTCLSAVDSLHNIAQDVIDTNVLYLLGPHFAFALWVSARLLLVHASTTGSEVDPRIEFFIETLAEMGRYWEVAASYSTILSRVTEEGRLQDKMFAEMRRCVNELAIVSSSTRLSTLEPTWTRNTTPNELDYVEVFDFFNYPRLNTLSSASQQDPALQYQAGYASITMDFTVPNLEADWLHFETPHE